MSCLTLLSDELARSKRPTLKEVLDLLQSRSLVRDGDRGLVKLCPSASAIRADALAGQIAFSSTASDETVAVQLPTSVKFHALSESGKEHQYRMALLDGAEVSTDGRVILTDRTPLLRLCFYAAPLSRNPSPLDFQIIRALIRLLGAERQCFRPRSEMQPELCRLLAEGLDDKNALTSFAQADTLDFAAIRNLAVPTLERVLGDLAQADWTLRELSRQQLANTLAVFGVRTPKRRRLLLSY